jgi:hypothetical protein
VVSERALGAHAPGYSPGLRQIHGDQKDPGCLNVSPSFLPIGFDRTLPSRFPVPNSAICTLYLALTRRELIPDYARNQGCVVKYR